VGRASVRLGRSGDDLVAEWPGFGRLRADRSGRHYQISAGDGVEEHEVLARLGPVIDALLRHLQGGLTLHASCISWADIAIAWLGDSGAGKSTIAAQLCACTTACLASDDATVLLLGKSILAVPSDEYHWLRPDMARAMGVDPGAKAKVAIRSRRQASGPLPLAAIVHLCFDPTAGEPRFEPMRGASAFVILSQATFRFALDVPEVLRDEFNNLSRLAREVPIYRLRRSRDVRSAETTASLVQQFIRDIGIRHDP
jgi:hypothetical protein